ncbi:hypothetical protein AAT19DRAFT_16305 [Rhodotorula toruloides]|uniref:J domain-containing protein n=1 Tax=Rhodotorula toruloides TaxID=5286 RepID=A0A2T0A312_RHOTO|nr:hypothetical protein AAT19DRAFT_16305 [Rhodotorula toruloides]
MTLEDCSSKTQAGAAVNDPATANSSEDPHTPHAATLDPSANDFVPSQSPPSDPPTPEPSENPYLAAYWAVLFALEQLESGFAVDAYMTLLRASPFASRPATPTQVSKLVAHVGKIRFQLNTGRFEHAMDELDKAKELWNAPEGRIGGQVRGVPWEAKVLRMKALEGLEDYDRLLQYADELIEDNPDDPPVPYYYKSLAHYHLGDLDEAEKYANEASEQAGIRKIEGLDSLLDRISRISTLKKAGNDAFNAARYDGAIEKYTEALAVDRNNNAIRAVLYTNRGIAHAKNSNKTQAMSDYRSSISLHPSYLKPYRLLASIYRKSNDLYSALDYLNRALRQPGLKGEEREAVEREREEVAREKKAQDEKEREEREERRRREQEEREERRRRAKAARETNHYTVLGIAVGATQTQIRIAYRKKALETHPHKGGCAEKFKKVQAAYEALCVKSAGRAYGGGSDVSPALPLTLCSLPPLLAVP